MTIIPQVLAGNQLRVPARSEALSNLGQVERRQTAARH